MGSATQSATGPDSTLCPLGAAFSRSADPALPRSSRCSRGGPNETVPARYTGPPVGWRQRRFGFVLTPGSQHAILEEAVELRRPVVDRVDTPTLLPVPPPADLFVEDPGEVTISLTARRARRAALALLDRELLDGTVPAHRGPLRVAARYLPAAHPGQIGGDVYDVASNGDDAMMLVADVRGKGERAARYATAILGAFRSYPSPESADPLAVAATLDATLSALGGPEDFATAVLICTDGPGHIVVVSCGHPPPLIASGGKVHPVLTMPALPLGLGTAPVAVRQEFPAGSRLLLYTDGLSEARNPTGDFFPLLDQGALLGADHLEVALDALVGRLVNHVRGMPEDDLTLVVAEAVSAP